MQSRAIGACIGRGDPKRGLDHPWADCVDADAETRGVKRRDPGKSNNGVLARGVTGPGHAEPLLPARQRDGLRLSALFAPRARGPKL